jgi:hypothetical protein
MLQLSSDPLFKIYAGSGAIFAGLFAQYLRGRAAAYRKRKWKWDRWKAVGLWFIVIIYIVIFEFISAFGVIVSKVDMEEQMYQQTSDIQTNVNTDLTDIRNDIRAKKEQRNLEFKDHGRGRKYNQFEDEIKALEDQRKKLEVKLNAVSKTSKIVSKSVFADLNFNTGIEAKWFKISMSSALLLLIFSAPLMFPWKISLDGLDWEAKKSTSPDTTQPEKALLNDSLSRIKELLEFTEALFSDFSAKLNGESAISKKTGIPIERCLEYRKYLDELHIGDVAVINKRQGGSVCNFSKDEVLQFLKSNYSKGFLDTLTGIG